MSNGDNRQPCPGRDGSSSLLYDPEEEEKKQEKRERHRLYMVKYREKDKKLLQQLRASENDSHISGTTGGSDHLFSFLQRIEKEKARQREYSRKYRQRNKEKIRVSQKQYYDEVVKPAREISHTTYRKFDHCKKKWVALFARYQQKHGAITAPSAASPPFSTTTTMMSDDSNESSRATRQNTPPSTLCLDGVCPRYAALIAPPVIPTTPHPRLLFDVTTTASATRTATTTTTSGLTPRQQTFTTHIGLVAAAAKHYEVSFQFSFPIQSVSLRFSDVCLPFRLSECCDILSRSQCT